MSMHSWELQKALYAKLNGNVIDDDGNVVTIYDDVPQGAAYPRVVIGEETASNNGTKSLDGLEHTVTIHVWSQYRGRAQLKQIIQSVYENLHDADITVAGADAVNVRQEFSTTLSENDNITRHGVMRFRVAVFDN